MLPNIQHQTTSAQTVVEMMSVKQIVAGQYQPRRAMNPDELDQLATSIRLQGILQPILVRAIGGQHYEILAGERRFRAAQLAGLDTVPVIIKQASHEDALVIGLVENLQRRDLNPIDEALGMKKLLEQFSLSQQQLSDLLGRSRSTIANQLRLLNLSTSVQSLLIEQKIESGHAKLLIALADEEQIRIAQIIVDEDLTVRQTEQLLAAESMKQLTEARNIADPSLLPNHKDTMDAPHPATDASNSSHEVLHFQDVLSAHLGTGVKIVFDAKRQKGRIQINYTSIDHFDAILHKLVPIEAVV
jgi:ParB family chromosome partitioning protein